MNNYGQWISDVAFEPRDILGFVYQLTMTDGRKYIGAKKVWQKIKRPPNTYKKQPKKPFKQSNWRSYQSSSKYITETLREEGIHIEEYRIVSVHDSWGKTLFAEAMLQIALNAVRSDEYLNMQCGGNFTAACWEDQTEDDIARLLSERGNRHVVECKVMWKVGHRTKYVKPEEEQDYLDKGWQFGRVPQTKEHTENRRTAFEKHTVPPFTLVNEKGVEFVVTSQHNDAEKLGMDPGRLSRLRTGDILSTHGWKLKNSKRPRGWILPTGEVLYTTAAKAAKLVGLNHETFRNYCVNALNGYGEIKAETKEDFQRRLALAEDAARNVRNRELEE